MDLSALPEENKHILICGPKTDNVSMHYPKTRIIAKSNINVNLFLYPVEGYFLY